MTTSHKTAERPIAKLEDFSGLKLRVIPNPVYLESFSAFKANPIPMAFGELYSALETRNVEHYRPKGPVTTRSISSLAGMPTPRPPQNLVRCPSFRARNT